MKILIYSTAFYPSIGGYETQSSLLAHEFITLGHEVKLVTLTKDSNHKNFPFEVIRKPSAIRLLSLTKWCDVFLHGNISLKAIWPLVLVHKPWVVAHHGMYSLPNGSLDWKGQIKFFIMRYSTSISVSQHVANHIPISSVVILNTFDDKIFKELPNTRKEKDLIFVGRLVSDKGANLLISSLKELKDIGIKPSLTIVGLGPEEGRLIKLSEELSVNDQIEFAGKKTGSALVHYFNSHKILIVPSIVEEGFGIVALEGIACGCVVIGSERGGLKEAIGPCGLTFPNGNRNALTQRLKDLLLDPKMIDFYKTNTKLHLEKFKPRTVAEQYLKVMEEAFIKFKRKS